MADPKVVVQIGAKPIDNEFVNVAEKLQDLISKSTAPSDQKKSAEKQLRLVEEYTRKINAILVKPKINRSDITNLQNFEAILRGSLGDLEKTASKATGIASEEMKGLIKEIENANAVSLKNVETIKAQFQGALKGKVPADVTFDNMNKQVAKFQETINAATADRDQLLKNAEADAVTFLNQQNQELEKSKDLQAQRVAEFGKVNGQELAAYKSLTDAKAKLEEEFQKYKADYFVKYNSGPKIIATATAAAEEVANAQIAAYQKQIAAQKGTPLDKLKTVKRQDERTKELGIPGIESYKQLQDFLNKEGKLYTDYYDGILKQQKEFAEKEARNGAVTSNEYKERISKLKELEKAQIELDKKQIMTPDQIAAEAKKIALTNDEVLNKQKIIQLNNSYIKNITAQGALTQKALDDEKTRVDNLIKSYQNKYNVAKQSNDLQYSNELKVVLDTLTNARQKLDEYNGAVKKASDEEIKANVKAQAFGNSLNQLKNRIVQLTSAVYILRKAYQKFREAVQIISDLDQQIIEIGIVSKQTGDELWANFSKFNQLANDLSTTTLKYLEGAKIFYQQGYETAQVIDMVNATTKAAALSSVSFTEASSTLTAAIRAFNMEASQAASVTDKFAAVGAQSAADFHELSVAMEKVASSAYSAGISFDATLGILAKGVETTREAPEAIGTALKTIIARFQEMKQNPLADLGEGVDANRVDKALKTIGVALRDTNGEFRDLDGVFNDLGSRWSSLTRNQKAYIATMAAGSRQQSRFMAMMNDYDRTLELIRVSTNSAGEANAQYAIYEDSVTAAHERMRNGLEALYASVLKSDYIKDFYDIMATGFHWLSESNPLVIALSASMAILITRTYALAAAKTIEAAATANANGQMVVELVNMPKLLQWITKIILAKRVETATTISLTSAQLLLNIALFAFVAIVGAVVFLLIRQAKIAKEAAEAVHKHAAEVEAAAQKEKEAADSLETKIIRYEELNRKLNRTNEEESERLNLIKQISDEAPDLVAGIDAEGKAILKRNEALEEEVKERQRLAAQKDRDAYLAKIESVKTAKWDATVEMGAPGARTAEIAAQLSTQLNNLGYGWWKQGDELIRGIEQGVKKEELLVDLYEQLGATLVSKDKLKQIDHNTLVMYAQGRMNENTELYKQTKEAVEYNARIRIKAGIAEGSQEIDALYNQISELIKVKNAEMGMLVASGLYGLGQYNLDILEYDRGEVSEATRDMVAGFAKFATEAASNLTEENIGVENAKMSVAEKIANYSQYIQEQMLKANAQLLEIPGFEKGLESLFKIKETGISANEMLENFNTFKIKYIDEITDPELKQATIELFESLSGTLFNEKDFNNTVNTIIIGYEEVVKKLKQTGQKLNLSDTLDFTEISTTLKAMPQKTMNFLLEGIDNIDSDEARTAFLSKFSEIFDFETDIGKKNVGIIQSLVENTDFTDPTAIQNMKQQIGQMLQEIGAFTNVEILQIVNGIANAEVILTDFVKKSQETYKQLQTLKSDITSAATGMDFGQALELTSKYGLDAVDQIGETFFLTGQAIEKGRRDLEAQVIANQESSISYLKGQIDDLALEYEKLPEEEVKRKEEIEETTLAYQNQIDQINKITDALKETTAAELARATNQNILTTQNAIAAVGNNLNDLVSLYDQISEKELDIFEISQLIAKNPDYLQYLDEKNGKLFLNKERIEEAAKAELKALKDSIAAKNITIAGAIEQLRAVANSSDEELQAKQEAASNAIKLMNSEAMSYEDMASTKLGAAAAIENGVVSLNKTEQSIHEQAIKRIKAEAEAYNILNRAKMGQIVSISGIYSAGGTVSGGNVQGYTPVVTEGTYLEKYLSSLGLDSKDIRGAAGKAADILEKELNKNLADIGAIDALIRSGNIISTLSSKKKSGKDFKAQMQNLDEYINYLEKIKKLQDEISAIEQKIDLKSTNGIEDLELLKQQGEALAEQASVLKQLTKRKEEDLALDRERLGNKDIFDWVTFDTEGVIQVNWAAVNSFKPLNEAQQAWIDGLVESIELYQEGSSDLRQYMEDLIEIESEQEKIYDMIIEDAIDIRQQLYDALVEADQKEIDELQEKYDKMTEMENKYLEAIKNSIDEERDAREKLNSEEELAQKKRKLATLQRDTSGMYSKEIANLITEIRGDEQELRDKEIDRQYNLLQKQYEVQEEQRNLEIESLQNQMDWREETGAYWAETDALIKSGPEGMMDILRGTEEYQKADPLRQEGMAEDWKNSIEKLSKLYTDGLPTSDNSVVNAITSAAIQIAKQIASIPINQSGQHGAGGTSVGTGTGSGTGSGTGTKTGTKTLTTAGLIQTALNKIAGVGEGLDVDNKFGPKSMAAMQRLVDLIINKLGEDMSRGLLDPMSFSHYLADLNNVISTRTINQTLLDLMRKYLGDGDAGFLPWLGMPGAGTKFAKGGLADYTGPAWVHGSANNPEAFLSAKQTAIFASLRDALESYRNSIYNPSTTANSSVSIGDIVINLANRVNASGEEIGKLVRKEIMNSLQGRVTMAVQRTR